MMTKWFKDSGGGEKGGCVTISFGIISLSLFSLGILECSVSYDSYWVVTVITLLLKSNLCD